MKLYKGYILRDLKFNEDLLIVGRLLLRKIQFIRFKNLNDNSIFDLKRDDVLYFLDNNRFKLKEVLK